MQRVLMGPWLVDTSAHRLMRDGQSIALEPMHMAVLSYLMVRAGSVVSAEEIMSGCWRGEPLGDNPVHKAIAALRRALGDSATHPQYIETIRKQGYRLLAPVQALGEPGPRARQGAWIKGSPFRGLEAFESRHAAVFFGRDAAVNQLARALCEQYRIGRPLVVLLGPSGAGKSSLVQAGLLPALYPQTEEPAAERTLRLCADATLDGGALGTWTIFEALAASMLDWELGDDALLSGYSIDTLSAALQQQPLAVIGHIRAGLDAGNSAGRLPALVIDRFEALLRGETFEQVEQLLNVLRILVDALCIALIVVSRNDHYAELARHLVLMDAKASGGHVDLQPPDADALVQMVRLPARAAGLHYGMDTGGLRRLDDKLCADALQAQDALPLLQYTLSVLYAQRSDAGELGWAVYENLGGLEGAIGARAEAVISALPVNEQEALPALLALLVVVSEEAGPPSGAWVPLDEALAPAQRNLIEALVEARLLVADQVAGVRGVRVAHEALLRRWPRVTAWVAQHRLALLLRAEVRPWVQRWLHANRPDNHLLPPGPLLWRSETGLREQAMLFDADDAQFIQRSVRRRQRNKRLRLAAVIASVAVAIFTTVIAVRNFELAREAQARLRESQRLRGYMLGELADQLRPLGKLDILGRLGEKGLDMWSEGDTSDISDTDAIQLAKAFNVIAEVQGTRGKGNAKVSDEAANKARLLLQKRSALADANPADYFATLGASWFWLGQNAFDAGKLDEAAAAMEQYRALTERWAALQPTNPGARSELGYALSSLGSIAVNRARWAQAQQNFEAAQAIEQQLKGEKGDMPETLSKLNSIDTWLGLVAYVRGQPLKALEYYDRVSARTPSRARGIAEESAAQAYARGVYHLRRGKALEAAGQLNLAQSDVAASVLALERAAAAEPKNQFWALEALNAKVTLALMRARVGATPPTNLAELDVLVAQTKMNGLAAEEGRLRTQVRIWLAQAWIALYRGDAKAAFERCQQAAQALGVGPVARPRHWQTNELIASVANLGMSALGASNQTAAQREWCQRMEATLAPALASGQAGAVLDASLQSAACAQGKSPSTADWQRIQADGYRTATMLNLPTINTVRTP